MNQTWKASDFVLIGLLAAVHAMVIYGVGMLTAVLLPVMHIFAASITALIMGSVVLFAVKKIEHFGAFTLLLSLGTAFFTLTGMGSILCLIFVLVASLMADFIISKTQFKTLIIGVGLGFSQAAYLFGGCFPFLFFLEREVQKWKNMGMGEEEIYSYVKYLTGGFAALGILSAIVCGIFGIYIGKAILKKHFRNMD